MMSPSPMPAPHILTSPVQPNLMYSRSSISDFQIERSIKPTHTPRKSLDVTFQEQYQDSVSRLLAAKDRPMTVSGRIPLDPSHLVLFFRSKSGITHSLDFPIDVDYNTPPALDVLIAACRPHQSPELDGYPDRESLFYPPNLPLTTTFEIANHPILEAIHNTFFPDLPTGHYLTVSRDQLEVVAAGGCMNVRPPSLRNDGRSATIIVTLPVRFRGGTLVIRDMDGVEERFYGRGGKSGDIEWVAFLADSEYEIETIQKGCRITISYGVYLRTFGPSGINPEPLITPSDQFLDLLSPVLNMSRGRRIGFYTMNDYGVNPAEVLAESLVPELKGGDSVLYHAIKLYKLAPELRWTAGGYIWPVDRTVDFLGTDITAELSNPRLPLSILNGPLSRRGTPAVRGAFSTYGGPEDEEAVHLRSRIEESGAIPLVETDITVLTNWDLAGPTPGVGQERVPFVSGGELEKLVVNVLIVVYIP